MKGYTRVVSSVGNGYSNSKFEWRRRGSSTQECSPFTLLTCVVPGHREPTENAARNYSSSHLNATERWNAVDSKILGENGRNGRCSILVIPTEKTITIVAQFTTKHLPTEEKVARDFVERYLAPEDEYLSKWIWSLWAPCALLVVAVVLGIHIETYRYEKAT